MAERKYSAPAADGMLELLEFLVDHPGAWGPSELSRRLEIGTNIIFRTLNILAERGYVRRNDAGRYELGAKLFSLGMRLRNRFDLRLCARPFLERLAEETRETCQLQIPEGTRMIVLECIPPKRDYFFAVTPGTTFYSHGNAFGRAVMAFRPEAEVDALFRKPLEKLTAHTMTDEAALRREFDRIRRTLIAEEYEEYVLGMYCIGSPVFDADGQAVAGIGVTAPTTRRNEDEDSARRERVRKCAADITLAIGGVPPHSGNIRRK